MRLALGALRIAGCQLVRDPTQIFHRKGRRERKGLTYFSKSKTSDCQGSSGPSGMSTPQTGKYQGVLCVLYVLCGPIAMSGLNGLSWIDRNLNDGANFSDLAGSGVKTMRRGTVPNSGGPLFPAPRCGRPDL